jgi:hypothetical protein
MRSIPKERWDDVIYIAPWMKRLYGINMLQRYSNDAGEVDRIAEDVVQVFHKMYPRSWGDKLASAIRFGCKAILMAGENNAFYRKSTLLDVYRILTDEAYRNRIFKYVDNDIVTNFLENTKMNTAISKLENPLSSENITLFLCQENGINMLEAMDQRKIIICNLDKDHLSENANLMSAVLMSVVTQCATKRASDSPPEITPYFAVAADEFYEYATKHINVLIEQMRKKNICVLLANQNRDQVPSTSQSAVAMAQTKFIHSIADEDLGWVSGIYKKWYTKEQLVSIPFHTCICDIHNGSSGRKPKMRMQPPFIPDHPWDYVKDLKYYSLGKAPDRFKLAAEMKTKAKTQLLEEDEKIYTSGELIFD